MSFTVSLVGLCSFGYVKGVDFSTISWGYVLIYVPHLSKNTMRALFFHSTLKSIIL